MKSISSRLQKQNYLNKIAKKLVLANTERITNFTAFLLYFIITNVVNLQEKTLFF